MSTKFEKNELTVDDNNKSQLHNFQIRPTQDQKFKTFIAKEIIQETLHKHLKDKDYSQIKAEDLSKTISSEIKDRLRDQHLNSRYKLMVQVVLGKRSGAGLKVAARCVWDADTDTLVSDQFLNETIFCSAVVFAVYFY